MSNVSLTIGGREYLVACAEGEEAHVTGLGRMIAEKIEAMGGAANGETRQLLFAALLLADEVHEARGGANRAAPPPPPAPAEAGIDPAALELIAERLETCAAALEDSRGHA